MSIADLIVLLVIVAILSLASAKLVRDRRRALAYGAGLPVACIGCPLAGQCSGAEHNSCTVVKQAPRCSCGS